MWLFNFIFIKIFAYHVKKSHNYSIELSFLQSFLIRSIKPPRSTLLGLSSFKLRSGKYRFHGTTWSCIFVEEASSCAVPETLLWPISPMRLTFHLRASFRVLPLVASSCPVLRLILRRMMRNCRSFGDYSFLRLTDSLKCDWFLFSFCDPVFRILCHLSCGLYRGHLFACALSFLTENDVQLSFFHNFKFWDWRGFFLSLLWDVWFALLVD